jgi:hypothetical protein
MKAACLETRKVPADDGCARAGSARIRPARAIATNILSSGVDADALDPRQRARTHPGIAIGVPWMMVLVHAAALVGSSMAGLAMALFLR